MTPGLGPSIDLIILKAGVKKLRKMVSPVTKLGYPVFSSTFIIELAVGRWDEEEENNRPLVQLMVKLVNAFEKWPRDMARVEREAVDFSRNIERVKIIDTVSRTKRVHVHLKYSSTPEKFMLIFVVQKKQENLLKLAAGIISDCVSKREDFEHLEVPTHLLADLNEAYDDIWRRVNVKRCKNCKDKFEDTVFIQCPSNITHKFCFNCSMNYIINYSSSDVFCPSGERCPLSIWSTVPWSFYKEEIETILTEGRRKKK